MIAQTARHVAALIFIVTLAGCVTAPQRTVSDLRRTELPPRLVVMPLDVELSLLSAGGVSEPNAEWTEAAHRNIAIALADEAKSRTISITSYQPGRGNPADQETSEELMRLHRAVGGSIMLHDYVPNFALPSKQGKRDWSLGDQAGVIARSQDADYALFIFVRDSYASAGRVVVMVAGALLGVGVPGGAQVGFASIVDLRSGDIIWFNRLARPMGDLRTPEAARETVKALLAEAPR